MSTRSNYAWILVVVFCLQPLSAFAQQDEDAPVPLPDGMIQFKSFHKQPWKPIIEYYANAAGLSLQVIEEPPAGTFDYEGGRVMTMQEGLDFLNQMLIPRDRVLIRNKDMLMLFDLTKGIPREIIEIITPDQLPERGAYEIMKCRFDISRLDGNALSEEVRQLVDDVHHREIALLPSANALIIQEQGHVLRDINNILIDAKKSWGQANFTVESLDLEHIAPEELFVHLPMLGVNSDTLSNDDGTLNLSWNPLDTRVIVSGDPQQIARLRKLVSEVDMPRDPNAEPMEPPYYQQYVVDGDATKMHEVLQTMLAGRNVNLDVDEDANKIHFRGRTPDHEIVMEIINKAQGSSDELAVFWIKEKDVDDVIETIETLFNLDDDETAAEGPRLAAETQNRLIARGTPNQMAVIRRMVSEIDVPYQRDASSRLPNRILTLSNTERNSTLNLLEDMLPAMDFNNDIRVVMPQDRVFQLDGDSELWDVHGVDRREQTTDPRLLDPGMSDPTQYDPRMTDPPMSQPADPGTPDVEPTRDDAAAERAGNRMDAVNPVEKTRNFKGFKGSFWKQPARPHQLAFATDSEFAISTVAYRPQQEQQEENGSGRTSSEEPPLQIQDEIPSVPGAPVTIRVTDFGLVLQSDDLEALDAIEDLIMQNLDASTGNEEFALFYLKHRDAVEAKAMLEKYLGIGGGGGGSGGALGGLMGGMLRNTVGEGAGNLVDTFMGGSGSGSDAGVFLTRGPVAIVADVQKYTLMISALPEDMTLVERLVNLIDQPNAPQQPNSIGETYTIDVLYRDPGEIADMVRESLGDLLKSADGQGGEQGNAQGRAEQEFIRALMGQRGGGGGGEEEELPKATLTVDQKNDKLVVTGPRFIYERVLAYVVKVDQPNNRPMQAFDMIEVQGRMDPHLLTELAQLLSEDNIEIIIDEDDGSDTSSQPGSSSQNSNRGGQNAAQQQMANLARLQQAMQQRARQQNQQQGGRGGGQGGRGQGGRGGGDDGGNPRGGGGR